MATRTPPIRHYFRFQGTCGQPCRIVSYLPGDHGKVIFRGDWDATVALYGVLSAAYRTGYTEGIAYEPPTTPRRRAAAPPKQVAPAPRLALAA